MSEKRILIIDPDTRFRKSLSLSLRSEGFHVEGSKNLTEGTQKMVQASYHCVIMDVNLPEIRGYEAVSILKNVDPKLQIIMTTDRNTMKLEAKVRDQDIYYYFIKSFGMNELKTAIHSLFKNNHGKEEMTMEKSDPRAKILIIDDDPDSREAVSLILKSNSYDYITADNPKEGEMRLRSEKPDLILLDIMMDSLFDGYSLCNAIKTTDDLKDFRKTPIIFVSAVKEKSGSRFTFNPAEQGFVGPDDYIDKPVRPEDLLSRIARLLKR